MHTAAHLYMVIWRPKSLSQYFSCTFRPFTPYATNVVLATLTLLTANAELDTCVCTLTTSAVCVPVDRVLCSATCTTDTSGTGNVMCHGGSQTSRKCSSYSVKLLLGMLINLWKVTISFMKSASQQRSQHIQTKQIFMKLHIWDFH
jgi:hypothetical protein